MPGSTEVVGEATPRRARQARPDHEGHEEDLARVDADGGRRLAVLGHRDDDGARQRPAQEPAETDQHRERHQRQEDDLIGRVGDAGDADIAQKAERIGMEIGLDTPDEALRVVQDHEDGEGDEKLERLLAGIDPLQEEALEDAPTADATAGGGHHEERID
jgi:hypothetical protein